MRGDLRARRQRHLRRPIGARLALENWILPHRVGAGPAPILFRHVRRGLPKSHARVHVLARRTLAPGPATAGAGCALLAGLRLVAGACLSIRPCTGRIRALRILRVLRTRGRPARIARRVAAGRPARPRHCRLPRQRRVGVQGRIRNRLARCSGRPWRRRPPRRGHCSAGASRSASGRPTTGAPTPASAGLGKGRTARRNRHQDGSGRNCRFRRG
jgi:hypothetical protein